MIFVTVGTHEQQFNRLIEAIDKLKENNVIKDEVIIQTGYSTYNPKYCKSYKLMPYNQVVENIKNARIVITHGGPASFIMPLQVGKIPVVVPRQYEFDEHVNNHQVEFVKAVCERMGTIIPVYDIKDLENVLINYDLLINDMPTGIDSNNVKFNNKLRDLVDEII